MPEVRPPKDESWRTVTLPEAVYVRLKEIDRKETIANKERVGNYKYLVKCMKEAGVTEIQGTELESWGFDWLARECRDRIKAERLRAKPVNLPLDPAAADLLGRVLEHECEARDVSDSPTTTNIDRIEIGVPIQKIFPTAPPAETPTWVAFPIGGGWGIVGNGFPATQAEAEAAAKAITEREALGRLAAERWKRIETLTARVNELQAELAAAEKVKP